MELEIVEIAIDGRNYETVVTASRNQRQPRRRAAEGGWGSVPEFTRPEFTRPEFTNVTEVSQFYAKTFMVPAFSGWIDASALRAVMVKGQAHRCCNVHGVRLEVARGSGMSPEAFAESLEKQKSHGKRFLACPHHGCDVGVWAPSNSLPGSALLRGLRSTVFHNRSNENLGTFALAHGIPTPIKIGSLSVLECQALLGLEMVGEPQRVVRPVRSLDLGVIS